MEQVAAREQRGDEPGDEAGDDEAGDGADGWGSAAEETGDPAGSERAQGPSVDEFLRGGDLPGDRGSWRGAGAGQLVSAASAEAADLQPSISSTSTSAEDFLARLSPAVGRASRPVEGPGQGQGRPGGGGQLYPEGEAVPAVSGASSAAEAFLAALSGEDGALSPLPPTRIHAELARGFDGEAGSPRGTGSPDLVADFLRHASMSSARSGSISEG